MKNGLVSVVIFILTQAAWAGNNFQLPTQVDHYLAKKIAVTPKDCKGEIKKSENECSMTFKCKETLVTFESKEIKLTQESTQKMNAIQTTVTCPLNYRADPYSKRNIYKSDKNEDCDDLSMQECLMRARTSSKENEYYLTQHTTAALALVKRDPALNYTLGLLPTKWDFIGSVELKEKRNNKDIAIEFKNCSGAIQGGFSPTTCSADFKCLSLKVHSEKTEIFIDRAKANALASAQYRVSCPRKSTEACPSISVAICAQQSRSAPELIQKIYPTQISHEKNAN